MSEQIYICPSCDKEIEGPRYSSLDGKGMICEDCAEKEWEKAEQQMR